MNWKEKITTIDNILELIEDKEFPARRNIGDYVQQLFDYPKDLEEYMTKFFEAKDTPNTNK